MVCGSARAEHAQNRKEANQRMWLIELVCHRSTHREADYLFFICATSENPNLTGGVEGPGGEGILCSRSLVYLPRPGRYLPSWFQWLPSQGLRAAAEKGATPAEEVIPAEEATPAEEVIPGRVEGSPAEEGIPGRVEGSPAEEGIPDRLEGSPAEEGTPDRVEGSPAEETTEDTPVEETTEDTPAEKVTGVTPAGATMIGVIMTEGVTALTVATMADAVCPSDSTARRIMGMDMGPVITVQALAAGTTINGATGSHIRATTLRMAIMAIS
jgi:hypothetical protein